MGVPARSFEHVGGAVPESPGGRDSKRGGVKPVVDGALGGRQVAVSNAVGQAAVGVGSGRVRAGETRGEELARLHIGDPIQVPAANHLMNGRWCVGEELFALAEWQFPGRDKSDPVAESEWVAAPEQRG